MSTAPSTAPSPEPKKRKPRAAENGAGSVYWDDTRSRWIAQGYLAGEGSPRVKRIAKTKTEARAALTRARNNYARGITTSQQVTVKQLIDHWTSKVLAEKDMSPDTRSAYLGDARRWKQHLGRMRADKVTVDHVEQALEKIAVYRGEEKPLAKATLIRTRRVLGMVFDSAVRRQVIQFNPARVAHLPTTAAAPAEQTALTEEQARRFLQVCAAAIDKAPGKHDPAATMFGMMLATGLGPAEATALPWPHVHIEDLDDASVTMAQTVQRSGGKGAVKDGGKNTFRTRSNGLPRWAAQWLARHQKAQRKARMAARSWEHPELVFTTSVGTLIDAPNLRRRFRALAKAAELPEGATPYTLRHTFASLAVEAGASLVVVADAMGHADTTMLSRVYRHRMREVERRHLAGLEGLG